MEIVTWLRFSATDGIKSQFFNVMKHRRCFQLNSYMTVLIIILIHLLGWSYQEDHPLQKELVSHSVAFLCGGEKLMRN